MTTPRTTVCRLNHRAWRAMVVAGKLQLAALALLLGGTTMGETPSRHALHAGAMPPGAIGRQRLIRGGPLCGVVQAIALRAPEGSELQYFDGGGLSAPTQDDLRVGLQVGQIYRFRLAGVAEHEQVELYPTVELLDRLHPPAGREAEFPVPVEITADDLDLAARGMLVTRVIYVEDPRMALEVRGKRDAIEGFNVALGEDPLEVADGLGRPIAILRIGGRRPNDTTDAGFSYGAPPVTPMGYGEPDSLPQP